MNIPREKRIGKFSLDIALRKTGKGYGIGSLLLTCNLLCSGSFSFVVNCQLTSSELTALTNISSVHSARYIVHSFILLGFPKFGGINFQSSVSTIFFKMAGMAFIYDFHHNTYSKTICSCLKTFGSFGSTLAFCKLCKLQQFHHLLPRNIYINALVQIGIGCLKEVSWLHPPCQASVLKVALYHSA